MPERESIPKDKVNLRLLTVNGKSHDFVFQPSTCESQIAHHVFHNWPSGVQTLPPFLPVVPELKSTHEGREEVLFEHTDWDSVQKPDRPEILRLIYRGKFLHDTTSLAGLSLPLGKTTVMHMVIRERLPDEQNTDARRSRNKTGGEGQAHSSCCVIL